MINNFFNFRRLLGYWLVSFAAAILVVSAWPLVKMELVYQLNKLRGVHFVIDPQEAKKIRPSFSHIGQAADIRILTPVDKDFSLIIPAIGLNAKVFAEVDFADEASAEKILSKGVAHAFGSSFPGQRGTIYLFAHSADLGFSYSEINAVFYLLNKLKTGDQVNVFHHGWRYTYEITEKNIVSADETSFFDNTSEERLILQTCWPPGTRWQRLVLVARPIYL